VKLTAKLVVLLIVGVILVVGAEAVVSIWQDVSTFKNDTRDDAEQMAGTLRQLVQHVWATAGQQRALRLIDDANREDGQMSVRVVWLDALPGLMSKTAAPVSLPIIWRRFSTRFSPPRISATAQDWGYRLPTALSPSTEIGSKSKASRGRVPGFPCTCPAANNAGCSSNGASAVSKLRIRVGCRGSCQRSLDARISGEIHDPNMKAGNSIRADFKT